MRSLTATFAPAAASARATVSPELAPVTSAFWLLSGWRGGMPSVLLAPDPKLRARVLQPDHPTTIGGRSGAGGATSSTMGPAFRLSRERRLGTGFRRPASSTALTAGASRARALSHVAQYWKRSCKG